MSACAGLSTDQEMQPDRPPPPPTRAAWTHTGPQASSTVPGGPLRSSTCCMRQDHFGVLPPTVKIIHLENKDENENPALTPVNSATPGLTSVLTWVYSYGRFPGYRAAVYMLLLHPVPLSCHQKNEHVFTLFKCSSGTYF